jgi:lysophospholipase L1-like esterase
MQKTGAKLIWASSTPIPDLPKQKYFAASIVERNQVAEELMQKYGIVIDDLFTAVTPHLAVLQNTDDVHFKGEGYEFLGKQVAASIEAAIE